MNNSLDMANSGPTINKELIGNERTGEFDKDKMKTPINSSIGGELNEENKDKKQVHANYNDQQFYNPVTHFGNIVNNK
ncbi:hypothetical protein ABK040_002807 [Willaertia magna]